MPDARQILVVAKELAAKSVEKEISAGQVAYQLLRAAGEGRLINHVDTIAAVLNGCSLFEPMPVGFGRIRKWRLVTNPAPKTKTHVRPKMER